MVDLLEAIGISVGIIASLFQLRDVEFIPKRRSALKTDLEILKSLDKKDPSYQTIKKNVDYTIVKIYSPRKRRNTARLIELPGRLDFIFSFTFFLVFSTWTFYLYQLKDGFTPGELVTGFFAFAGLGGILHIIEEITEKWYFFSWNEIPGKDNGELIKFLKKDFGIDWAKTAKIEKIDDDSTIRVFTEKNFLSLKLNDEEKKVNLEIDDGRAQEFTVEKKNRKLNIYKKI